VIFPADDLSSKHGLVGGVANAQSIASAALMSFVGGAERAITYRNDSALPHVAPVARATDATILAPCDVRSPGHQLDDPGN